MEGNSGKRKLSFKVAKTGLIFVTYIFHNYYFKNMLLLTKKKKLLKSCQKFQFLFLTADLLQSVSWFPFLENPLTLFFPTTFFAIHKKVYLLRFFP